MAKYERVIVVGGGVGGMTVALALHRAGIPVELHERHDSFQHHATGFTIWSHAVEPVEIGCFAWVGWSAD